MLEEKQAPVDSPAEKIGSGESVAESGLGLPRRARRTAEGGSPHILLSLGFILSSD